MGSGVTGSGNNDDSSPSTQGSSTQGSVDRINAHLKKIRAAQAAELAAPQQGYYVMARGAEVCDRGIPVTKAECQAAVKLVAGLVGMTPKRNLMVGSGGRCMDGSWGQVPPGCSVQSGDDWT